MDKLIKKLATGEEKKFRIHTSTLFLTYKQSNDNSLSKEYILDWLKLILNKEEVKTKFIVVAYEVSDSHHTYKHFHVLIKLTKQIDITGQNFFDINGIHGQYEKTRNITRALQYVLKDGCFTYDGEVNLRKIFQSTIKDPLERFLVLCTDLKLSLSQALELKDPNSKNRDVKICSDYLKHPKRYESFIVSFYHQSYIPKLYIALKLEKFEEILSVMKERKKSLFIYGPTGIGKTSLFLVMLQDRILFTRHKDALKHFDRNKHLAVLFDDMDFRKESFETMINITDQTQPSHIDVKRSMITLPPQTNKIFTSNKDFDTFIEKISFKEVRVEKNQAALSQIQAIKRRVHIIKLEKEDIQVRDKPFDPGDKVLITLKTLAYLIKRNVFPPQSV